MEKTVCELFAGVGGFSLRLDRLDSGWKPIWFSQWEPGAKEQWAHKCFVKHYGDMPDVNGEYHTCEDIAQVDKSAIPDHTLLVAGFPCQDYSVARTLSSAKGIEGSKGVMWWQIVETIMLKRPPFCLFENVDRLLRSPAKQRGRDFGIILASLNWLGYNCEWRVVNAAKYGAGQKRRRTYIFVYRRDTAYNLSLADKEPEDILSHSGLMAKAFPITEYGPIHETTISRDIGEVSQNFRFNFENAGRLCRGTVCTASVAEQEEKPITLGELLQGNVPEKYYYSNEAVDKLAYLKGAKKLPRKSKDGYEYIYSEGAMTYPDSHDKPGRTMLTSESGVSRTSHAVADPETGRIRRLTPIEAERLQGFDDDWTNTGMPERMRYFCAGNALVVPMITRIGKALDEVIERENSYEFKRNLQHGLHGSHAVIA